MISYSKKLVVAFAAFCLLASALFAETDNISEGKLKKHISYLASDQLEGRLSGSEGGAKTEKYLKEQFIRLNLSPLSAWNGYYQSFSFTSNVSLAEGNSVTFYPGNKEIVKLEPGKDFIPASFSEDCGIKGAEIVFAGFGIKSKDPERNDYAGLNVKDKIVIVFRDGPDGDDPKSKWAPFYSTRYKASTVKESGAKAVIVVSQNDKADELPKMKSGAAAGSASIPVLSMKLGFLKRLFEMDDKPFPAPSEIEALKSFQFEKTAADLNIKLNREKSTASNVAALLPATVKTDETIIIGAHWDHLGRGIEGSLAEKYGEIHHGADDNGSGIAGLLELARVLSMQKERKKNILFAAFAAEELGGLGSVHFTKNPPVPLTNVITMINLDMIGRFKEKVIVDGAGTAKEWKSILETANREKLNMSLHEDGYGASDHSSFYAKSVPVLFFFTGAHGDYHLPSDTPEKINYEGEAKILSVVKNVVDEIMNMKAKPAYAATEGNAGGGKASFKVYVGTVPDFTEEGKGFKILSVRPGSPAEKAGIKGGDLLVSLGGKKIENIYDYTYALQDFKPEEEAEAVVVREGKEVNLKVVFGARKVTE
jgi:aminopeptidase YwaD